MNYKSGRWAKSIMLTLIVSMIFLNGCATGRLANEAIPDFPEPRYEFMDVDGRVCLDGTNRREYLLWMLALERYKLAVEGLK